MYRSLFLITFILAFAVQQASAQIIQTPVNTALGGGGTAYTTGYESLFINPANLFIQEKEYRFQFSAGSAGTYFSSPMEITGITEYWDNYLLQTQTPDNSSPGNEITDYSSLIARNFNNGQMLSDNQSRGEIHWLGMHWSRLDKSYAIALRTRFANRFVIGRNYYDFSPVNTDSGTEFNRTLAHQFQTLHELSFGYAESFSFINGLIPQLSQLIVGIAPKFVASGAYLNHRYNDQYINNGNENSFQRNRSFSHYSTGSFTEISNNFMTSMGSNNPLAGRFDLFEPTGYGAGLDLGLTYLITLGDDFSVVRISDPRTRKSLRLSLSITDIGFIYYSENPRQFSYDEQSGEATLLPQAATSYFQGRPGEHFQFLHTNGGHPLFDAESSEIDTFSSLLPTTVHAGLLFQVSRIKIMGDFSFALVNNAFHSTRPTTYLGTELRLLSFLPLRAGLRLTPELPDYVSIGSGIETRYFDLNFGIQFRSRAFGFTDEITGLSTAALKIYIP